VQQAVQQALALARQQLVLVQALAQQLVLVQEQALAQQLLQVQQLMLLQCSTS
jgi:hypothetical protein